MTLKQCFRGVNLMHVFNWIVKSKQSIKDETAFNCWKRFYLLLNGDEILMINTLTTKENLEVEESEEFIENIEEVEVENLEDVLDNDYNP